MKNKLISVIAAAALAMTSFAALAVTASADASVSYEKVTATEDITNGEYLLVCEANSVAFDGSLSTLDAVSNTIGVTIENGKIASSETVDAAVFTIDTTAGTLKSAKGYYIGVTSNSNGLRQSDNEMFGHEFSVDDDGNAVIKAIFGDSNMTLRFNAQNDQNRFRYYKNNGQQPIALYKKTMSNAASATYSNVGDYTGKDDAASAWSITVTPGDDTIENIDVKVNGKGSNEGVWNGMNITGGTVVFGVAVNLAAADVSSVTAVVNGSNVTTTLE